MRAHTLFESPNQRKQGDQFTHSLLQNRFYYRNKNEKQLILLLIFLKCISFEVSQKRFQLYASGLLLYITINRFKHVSI